MLSTFPHRFGTGERTVMTTDTSRSQGAVIDFGSRPNCRTGMAGFARLRSWKMNRRLAGGCCKHSMTLRARAGGLYMIDLGYRFPHGVDMARLAQRGRGGMSARLAVLG